MRPNIRNHRRLRRVRERVLGRAPTNLDDFDPETVFDKLDGGGKVIVIDSNTDLPKDWGERLGNLEKKLTPEWEKAVEERESELDKTEATTENIDGSDINLENESVESVALQKRILVGFLLMKFNTLPSLRIWITLC